uniref:Uncharacterized protein n=1 Tax=Meloidogyne incognita TaxID=6306 RepID=A0A914MYY6_MELIC
MIPIDSGGVVGLKDGRKICSIPESQWDEDLALHCSADYHVNNACSPVLFYDMLTQQ